MCHISYICFNLTLERPQLSCHKVLLVKITYKYSIKVIYRQATTVAFPVLKSLQYSITRFCSLYPKTLKLHLPEIHRKSKTQTSWSISADQTGSTSHQSHRTIWRLLGGTTWHYHRDAALLSSLSWRCTLHQHCVVEG